MLFSSSTTVWTVVHSGTSATHILGGDRWCVFDPGLHTVVDGFLYIVVHSLHTVEIRYQTTDRPRNTRLGFEAAAL